MQIDKMLLDDLRSRWQRDSADGEKIHGLCDEVERVLPHLKVVYHLVRFYEVYCSTRKEAEIFTKEWSGHENSPEYNEALQAAAARWDKEVRDAQEALERLISPGPEPRQPLEVVPNG